MDQPLWQRLRDDSIAEPGRMRIHAAEHRMIYEAIVAGDAEAASFYSVQHINRVRALHGALLMARFEGIIPAVTTPFTADDQVDVPALKENIEKLIEAGVHGFVATGHDGRGGLPHP